MTEPRINANEHERKHWDLCHEIVGVARALRDAGFNIDRQIPTPIWFRGSVIGEYKADLLVNKAVLLELKAAQGIDPSHKAQILNYLRATEIEVGLLLNFGPKPLFPPFRF